MSGGVVSEVTISYFVPQDGDTEARPNVYSLRRPLEKIRLGDIKSKFPLPGNYHFRFKRAFGSSYVWFDIADDYAVVPNFDGMVCCKVTRLETTSSSRLKANNNVVPSAKNKGGAAASEPVVRKQPAMLKTRTSSENSSSGRRNSGDLLGLDSPGTSPSNSPKHVPMHPRNNNGGVADLLSGSIHRDSVMDLDWPTDSPSPSPSPTLPPPSLSPSLGGGIASMSLSGSHASSQTRSVKAGSTSSAKGRASVYGKFDTLSQAAKDFQM